MKVTPKMVSMRVVNAGIDFVSSPYSEMSNSISTPSDRPIQFTWLTLTPSGHSMLDMSSSSSAYLVMAKYHCGMARLTTVVSQRSHLPSLTCSLASVVWSCGHQLTAPSDRYASPISRNLRKKYWFHL